MTPRNAEQLDEKGWIILRLMVAIACRKDPVLRNDPDFIKTTLWMGRNQRLWDSNAPELLKAERKAREDAAATKQPLPPPEPKTISFLANDLSAAQLCYFVAKTDDPGSEEEFLTEWHKSSGKSADLLLSKYLSFDRICELVRGSGITVEAGEIPASVRARVEWVHIEHKGPRAFEKAVAACYLVWKTGNGAYDVPVELL